MATLTPEEDEGGQVPGYMIAANGHNIGNLNSDWFAAGDVPQQSLGKRVYNMVGAAAFSGVNSFANTATWAGNWFSDKDNQYRDTRGWIASYDEDMAKYYDQNRQAADLIGFVAGSFVPGLGGVKVFNAGAKMLTAAKEGVFGINMSRGFGVLPGSRDILVKEAVESYATTRTAFSLTNPQTLKAVASGFGEQALQAAAFETAVAVTMKKSPILNDMDAGDMVSHIASGALLGGAIGGVVEGAVTLFKVRAGIKAMDTKLAGVTQDVRGVAGTSASDDLLIIRNDLDTLAQNAPEGVEPALYGKLYEDKWARADNNSRTQFTKIAGGDAELGNRVYEGIRQDPTGAYASKVLNLEEIGVMKDLPDIAKKYEIGKSLADGEVPDTSVRFLKLWGDDAGKLSDEMPSAIHLADTLKSGSSVEVRAQKVMAGDKSFEVVPGKYHDTRTASYEESLARNIWAMDNTVPPLAVPKGLSVLSIGEADIPMLTKAYREGFTDFNLVNKAGETFSPPTRREDLLQYIANLKNNAATAEMYEAGGKVTAEQVANKYDVPLGFLTGEQYALNTEEAVFGLARAQKQYFDRYHLNTPNPPDISAVKPWLKQQNHPMVYKTSVGGYDNFQVEALTVIRERQKLQQATNEVAVLAALGEKGGLLPNISEAEMQRVNRGGAGAGFFTFANSNYGTAGSKAEYVGGLVTRWIRDAETKVGENMAGVNYALVNSPQSTAALASVMQRVRAAGSRVYVMDDAGQGLILRDLKQYNEAIAAGDPKAVAPIIPDHILAEIPLDDSIVRDWVKKHIAINGDRTTSLNNIRGAKGQPASYDPAAFYPPAPNPERFKFHAFAMDDQKIISDGHTTMLYADSAASLEKQMAEARAQGFSVVTPQDTAAYYKARGQYDFSKGLNENQMDAALRREGSSAPAFPITGTPQEILQDIMQWHAKQEAIVIREAVSTKYSREFGTFYQMGEEYSKVANSKIGFFNKIQGETKNPFEDYVKTFLGASLKKDYPLWTALNNFVDEVGTRTYNAVSNVFKSSKSVYDLDEVNKIFDKYGVQMAATPAQMEAWANHPAGTAVVSKFVGTQNAILSSLVLRLDPVNALNNALGSVILTGAETKAIIRAMNESGSPEAVGELASLMKISLPGTGDGITSAAKMYATAVRNYFGEGSKELLAKYKSMGFVSDTSDQFKQLLEVSTIKGTETAAELEGRRAQMYALANKLVDKGEKWTGNKFAEEMNRFVSANIMDQITSVAVKAGVMDSRTAASYINTFVNRTQGNIIASQRPQIFQGPVGQAIGLFQSYQFNIMQQLLRYVGEGQKKDAMTLLGLQSTIYGMNGLPAFQAVNQHIIGNASGNTQHRDAYTSVNNIAGKQAGDWIMYGVASNMLIDPDLKINLYSRGDINPRQVSIVPTNMAEVPVVASWARMTTAIAGSVKSIQGGGDVWNSILSGIEHQGINRPLAGFARVARGTDEMGVSYSTSGKGNVVSANDLNSLANLARLSGAKPFDEAVTQDAVFRIQAYQAKDKERKDALGKSVKSVIAGGGVPTAEQMEKFMENYASIGGKQEEFNKWYVSQVKSATTPQANKLAEKVGSPYASYMQTVMGGRMLATPQNILATQEPQE